MKDFFWEGLCVCWLGSYSEFKWEERELCLSFISTHFSQGNAEKSDKGEREEGMCWEGSDKCWALMMLCLSVRSKILRDRTFIKKWLCLSSGLLQTSNTAPDTGDLQTFAHLGMFGLQPTSVLCKLVKDQHTTNFAQRVALLPSQQDRKNISQQLLFTQFKAGGGSPHYKSALCPAEPVWPSRNLNASGISSGPRIISLFLLFSESTPEEISASEQTWHNRTDMKSRNWTRCKTPPK